MRELVANVMTVILVVASFSALASAMIYSFDDVIDVKDFYVILTCNILAMGGGRIADHTDKPSVDVKPLWGGK